MRASLLLPLIAVILVGLLIYAESPVALAIVLADGLLAAGILAVLAVPVVLLWRWLVGSDKFKSETTADSGSIRWFWLAIVPFAALTLIVATAPPGTLWAEEANGYDVLEYHLAVPKEYCQAGGIHFLPHNVYSNFPLNAEMLYLLAMILRGGPLEGLLTAQMMNAILALLTVAAIWTAARPFGRRAAILAGVLVGTCGWLVYLSGVAYVENAMMLFTALALAARTRWHQSLTPLNIGWRWVLLSGLFAGLACGCKYTAIVLVAVPLAVAFVIPAVMGLRFANAGTENRNPILFVIRVLAIYALGIFVTFSPWLVRNIVCTGNPVFPLASNVFGYRAGVWDAESAERWEAGHQPPEHTHSLSGWLQAVGYGVILHKRTGAALWLLAVAALLMNRKGQSSKRERGAECQSPERKRRVTLTADRLVAYAPGSDSPQLWPLAVVVLLQVLLWAVLTHRVDRMAVPIVPVLALLAALAAEHPGGRIRSAVWGIALLGAAVNLYHIAGLYYDHTRVTVHDGRVAKLAFHGQTQWFIEGQWPGTAHLGYINQKLSPDAKVLLVGDARSFYVQRSCGYCVVFNPNPLAKAVREARDAAGAIAWLRQSGYTHVYVDLNEMRRLRSTYGFWPEIDAALFERLEAAGLKRLQEFAFGEGDPKYGMIYEVPK